MIDDENGWMYWYKYVYYPTYNRLDGLLVGVSIAGIYQFSPKIWSKISKYGNQFIVLSLAILTGAYFLCEDAQSFNASIYGFPLVAIGYGFMVIGAISPTSFMYKWNSKVSTFIASLSYAIYLTHKGIIQMTHGILVEYKIDSNLMLLICIITCTLGALLLNRIIERPFMKLRTQIVDSKYNRALTIGIFRRWQLKV